MTPERLAELHEAAKYALSHGNGQVTVSAKDLIEVLPTLPTEEKAAESEAPAALQPTAPLAVEGAGADPAKPEGAVTAEDVKTTSEVDLGTGPSAEVLTPAVAVTDAV